MANLHKISDRERKVLEGIRAEIQKMVDRFQHGIEFIAVREGLQNAVFDDEAWTLTEQEQEEGREGS